MPFQKKASKELQIEWRAKTAKEGTEPNPRKSIKKIIVIDKIFHNFTLSEEVANKELTRQHNQCHSKHQQHPRPAPVYRKVH